MQAGFRRREFLAWGLSAFGLSALAGCRRAAGTAVGEELTLWANPSGVEEQAFLRLCRRYEAEHPAVKLSVLGASDDLKLTRAIAAGAPPDLAYLYGTTSLGPLAANDALTPLDAEFTRAGFQETDFLPGAIAQGRYQGKLYAMPVTRDSRALYWNRTRFREANLDPDKPPQTLEEALDFATRLTTRAPDGTVTKLGMLLPEDPAILFFLFGGGVWDEQSHRITADRPENATALRWHVALADAQGGYKAVAAFASGFGTATSAQNPMATGKIAFKIDGEWAAMHFERFAPQTDYALGELPYPAARPDLKNMAWQDGDIMVIPVGSRHPERAWEFMRWMQQPRQQLEYAPAMNNLPTRVALRDDPAFAQGSRSRRALGYVLRQIASNARNAHFFPSLPVTQLYQASLKDAFDRALFHEKTPEEALAAVQVRVERELRRYASP